MTFTFHPLTAAKVALLSAAALAAVACGEQKPQGRLASVGDAVLTEADLLQVMPRGLSPEDSLAFVKSYVDSWVSDRLVTEVAVKNLPDTKEIDRMVEEYRRSLIMWEYVRLKVAEEPSLQVSDDSVSAYYERHRAELTVSEPMVRGIYIKLPSESATLADVRRWYRSGKSADIEKLEKIGTRDAITYDYFADRWVYWKQVEARIPRNFGDAVPAKGQAVEVTDSAFTYLLYVTDRLPLGAQMPLEVARERVLEKLNRENAVAIERRLRDELLRKALDDGDVIIEN
jgi:hypothetical protein